MYPGRRLQLVPKMSNPLIMLVDGDACPVKEEIFKVCFRYNAPAVLVANSVLLIPRHELLTMKVVSDGFDAADDDIADEANGRSIVITSDILLADRCLKVGACFLSPTGKPFTEDSTGAAIATRAIMNDLRGSGDQQGGGGPAPFSKGDRSRFLSVLDETIVRMQRLT